MHWVEATEITKGDTNKNQPDNGISHESNRYKMQSRKMQAFRSPISGRRFVIGGFITPIKLMQCLQKQKNHRLTSNPDGTKSSTPS